MAQGRARSDGLAKLRLPQALGLCGDSGRLIGAVEKEGPG